MSLSSQFGTNPDKETNGVVFEYAPNPDGTVPTVTLAHMGRMNKAYAKALDRATRQYRRADGELKIDPALAERIFQTVFIQTIMKGWSNIQLEVLDEAGKPKMGDDGKPEMEKFGALNEADAKRVFERLPYFYDDLQGKAKNDANFQDDAIEAEGKN